MSNIYERKDPIENEPVGEETKSMMDDPSLREYGDLAIDGLFSQEDLRDYIEYQTKDMEFWAHLQTKLPTDQNAIFLQALIEAKSFYPNDPALIAFEKFWQHKGISKFKEIETEALKKVGSTPEFFEIL